MENGTDNFQQNGEVIQESFKIVTGRNSLVMACELQIPKWRRAAIVTTKVPSRNWLFIQQIFIEPIY